MTNNEEGDQANKEDCQKIKKHGLHFFKSSDAVIKRRVGIKHRRFDGFWLCNVSTSLQGADGCLALNRCL